MKPLFVLIGVFCVAALTVKLLAGIYDLPLSAGIATCAMLCFTAIRHIAFTKGMTLMIPEIIPFKVSLVCPGILEVMLGIGLLIPDIQVYTGLALIVFFILLLPANIYPAVKHIDYENGTFNGSGITYLGSEFPCRYSSLYGYA